MPCDLWGESMTKKYDTLQHYLDYDQDIICRNYDADYFRVSTLSDGSNDVTFTATRRNGLVVDLTGTARHLTRMDRMRDETPTRPGDACLIAPGSEVQMAWETIGDWQDNLTLEFDSDALAAYLPEFDKDKYASGHLCPATYAQRPVLANLARMLGREVDPVARRGRLFSDSVMRLLTLEIAGSYWSVPMPPTSWCGGADTRVNRAVDFIESKYADDITLAQISQASGLSLTQLTQLFQRQTGLTPYAFVVDRRLRQASHLLATSDMPIAHVAIATGFSDQQHLTRVCRAHLNRTPRQLRYG